MTFLLGCFDWHPYLTLRATRLLSALVLSLQSGPKSPVVSGLLILFILFLLPT